MQHYRSLYDVKLQGTWLTIGSFDGVHRGHQAILQKLTAGAHENGAPAVVLTFFPHPALVLGKRSDPFYLTSPEERAELMGELGVDVVITEPFTHETANITAHDFMSRLSAQLGLRSLWIGHDFALGKGRQGDAEMLARLGGEFGYSLHVVAPVKDHGETISSSLVRQALAEGQVEEAGRLLGRPYRVPGRVIPGDGRGRTIGIPTANLDVWSERVIPKSGVYACRAWVDGQVWNAVTNVGVRPTFESQTVSLRVETHLLDYNQDLYGREVALDFIARLRDEQRFPNVQALVEQIQQDIRRGREILSAYAGG